LVRGLSFFFMMFSLLSLIVHLNAMFQLFGGIAVILLAVDFGLLHYSRQSRAGKMRRAPLI